MPRKDTNPQFLSSYVTESAVNTYTERSFTLPIVHDLANGKALVVELLRIIAYMNRPSLVNATIVTRTGGIRRNSGAAILPLSDPNCLFYHEVENQCFDTAATDATVAIEKGPATVEIDFTDGNGNGLLIADQTLYGFIQGTNEDVADTGTLKFKLLFRLKEVSAQEMLGILGMA